MCGITGIVSKDALRQQQVDLVARLNNLLIHRGPDGEGEYHDHHVALAMRRLSIIDLASGWQPLYNEDKSLVLVANGEVYNFVELRKALETRGHRFRTQSDCETILHLYEEHGDRCVDHLRGMYAFAIWDTRKRRLLLGRDRMGEKPLYLVCTEKQIVFASELKSLLRGGVVPFELDPAAVHLFYHFNYIPEPMTAVRGVRKLPAGHTLSVEVDRWEIRERCYWRMQDAPPLEGDPPTLIRQELERVSELIIRSDVPVGLALSGGMDSSAIATLAASKYPGTLHAFSVGYSGRPLQDERYDAKLLADRLNMPFHEIELTTRDVVRDFPKMVHDRDDPIADVGGSNYHAVMKLARSHNVPVMLMGHGGDEMFWGYGWVTKATGASRRKMALRNAGAGLGDYLNLTRPPYSYTGGVRWLKSLGGLATGWHQYRRDLSAPAERMVFYDLAHEWREAADQIDHFYGRHFAERINGADPAALFTIPQPWPNIDVTITRLICDTYLLENGIAQGDRLGMTSSVELRLPLVDYRLVETVIGLRKMRSDSGLEPKKWLRDAVRDLVPPFVMERRKRGFTPPWRSWAKGLSDAYGDMLLDGYLVQHGVLDSKAARELRRKLSPPPLGMPSTIADCSLVLEVWCRQMAGDLLYATTDNSSYGRVANPRAATLAD